MRLADFLARVNGGRVSPREQLAAQRVWERFADRAQRRAGLCSLLARSQEEWDDLALTFDACFPVGAEAPRIASGRTGRWGSVVLLCFFAVFLHERRAWTPRPSIEPPRPLPVKQADPPREPERFGPPPPPPPQVQVTWELAKIAEESSAQLPGDAPWLPLLASLPFLLLGLRWLLLPWLGRRGRTREQAEKEVRLLRQREEAAEQHLQRRARGAPHLELYRVPEHPRFDRAVLEDCALYLGRVFRAERGVDLHVGATLQATLEAGGRLTARFVPGRSVRELLVLCDREVTSHPDHESFLRVLEFWERLGVRILRYSFQKHPVGLDDPRGGRVALRDLGRLHPEAALLLFSRRRNLSKREHRWARDLAAWSLKAWIDPDPLPPLPDKRPVIRHLLGHGMARFPYSRAGLLALARYLAADGVGIRPPRFMPLPEGPEVDRSLEFWAAAAALVPDPSWEQLEDLRQSLPEIAAGCTSFAQVHQLTARLHERAEEDVEGAAGDKLEMPRWLEEQLVRWAQAEHPDFVRRVDALLLKHLAEPPCRKEEDPFLYARWELKRASHLVRRQQNWAEVERLVDGPLATEGRGLLRAAVEAPGVGREERLRVLVRIGDQVELLRRDLLLGHGRLWWMAAGLALVPAAIFLGLRSDGRVRVPVPAHYKVEKRETPLVVAAVKPPEPPPEPRPEPAPRPPRRPPRRPPDMAQPDRPDMAQPVALERPSFMAQPVVAQPGPVTDCKTCKPSMVQLGSYALAESEVTQGQYYAVMGQTPSGFSGASRPVERVSWYDAIDYCNKLSEREGRTTCYKKEGDQVEWIKGCTGYRLPTEAEWERAAKAGQGDRFAGDDGKNDAKDYAWFGANSGNETHPVKTKKPNAWGLYDMSGNVWEWVWDKYDTSGSDRVFRGGSFRYSADALRPSDWGWFPPGDRRRLLGFRVARSLR